MGKLEETNILKEENIYNGFNLFRVTLSEVVWNGIYLEWDNSGMG
jgi:hypothetical protein